MDGHGPLAATDQYSITGDQLMIANVSAISDWENKTIRCCEVLNNGIVVTGEVYMVEPLSNCSYCTYILPTQKFINLIVVSPNTLDGHHMPVYPLYFISPKNPMYIHVYTYVHVLMYMACIQYPLT